MVHATRFAHGDGGRYRRLFETAQDGILILDAETGQVLDANPFMRLMFGYSLEEFVGRKLWEIGPFQSTEASKIAFAELQEKDRLHYEGLSLETHDGRRVEVEFASNAFLVNERRIIRCNFRDVTERKRLGLAIVRRLVERRGGKVWAESVPAHGATFSFTVPDEAATSATSGEVDPMVGVQGVNDRAKLERRRKPSNAFLRCVSI